MTMKFIPIPLHLASATLLSAFLWFQSPTASASGRRLAFTLEATVEHKGEIEYEQHVTWKSDKDLDSSFNEFAFRHELEFGITDRFQMAIYFFDWRVRSGDSVSDDGFDYQQSGIELKYMLLDPRTDVIGFTPYFEVLAGEELLKLEGKLILQKNLESWIFAYNFVLESEWKGSGLGESNGEIKNLLGVSYKFADDWFAGFEFQHEIEIEGWSEWSDHSFYVGPNLTYKTGRVFVTLTPLIQVSSQSGEPNLMARTIVGYEF